jgi:hypothetical protein
MMNKQKYSILVIAASLLLAGCAAEQPSSPEAQYASEVCTDSADAGSVVNESLKAFAVNFAGGNYVGDKQREAAACRLQAMAEY